MFDAARIRFVTAYFPHLQGLNALPWAAYLVADVAWDLGGFAWLPRTPVLTASAYSVLGIAVAWVIQWRISRYYRRTYGSVTPDPTASRVRVTMIAVVGYLALTALFRRQSNVPDVGLFFVAACLFWTAYAHRPYRPHFLLLAIGACVLAVTPLLAWPEHALQLAYGLSIAIGLAIAGIGDHWVLARTLSGSRDAIHANAG